MIQEGKPQNEQKKEPPFSPDNMKKIIIGAKIGIVALATVCTIMVIFILAKSSVFFAFMFSLEAEIIVKEYLKSHFMAYMSTLYFAIFGFVVSVSNTILFFYKFTQKDKILWFNLAFFLCIFISGIVALSDKSYHLYMVGLIGHSIPEAVCMVAPYYFECSLASTYLAYHSNVVVFFIIFIIFFAIYIAVYHISVVKFLPFAIQQKQNDMANDQNNKSSIFANKKQETFVSEMFDEYMN